ncbi:MAG TPA: hypothetical protein VJJ52_06510 [Candidatus Nanoarchaeia archaeon]|nr:hypothetical protein [Candidatus Nanoarchaeia archaeon]
MAGFWTEYYSTLFKGLTATSWKEKIEARKLVRGLKKEDHALFVTIRKEVGEHRVTRALKDLNRIVPQINKTAEIAEKLIFNEITQERQAINAEKSILDALKKLSDVAAANPKNQVIKKIERELAVSIYQGSKDAESEDRKEYKIVLEILDESHLHHKDWMEKIRLMFQKEDKQSILTRWALRSEIADEKRDIKMLRRVAEDILGLIPKVKAQKDAKRAGDLLESTLVKEYERVRVAVQGAFKNTYLIKKRVLLMFMKILFDLHTLRQMINKWEEESNLPRESSERIIEKVQEVEDNIAKHFQPLAQGFRILVSAIDNIQNLALKEEKEFR